LIVSSQYLGALNGIYGTVAPYSTWLANALVGLALSATGAILLLAVNWIQQKQKPRSQPPKRSSRPVKVTASRVQASLGEADELIAQLHNQITRRSLQDKATQIGANLEDHQFHLVVFGSSSAGKTSLVNALMGRCVGETAATLGTTQQGSVHTYEIPGRHGSILLTDTPGLQTIGYTGEEEAKALAQTADLLLFVVAGDLLASEYEELLQLAQLGKCAILVLNKTDQMVPEDQEIILQQLRSRTAKVIPPDHIIPIAADPQPLKVRHVFADGSVQVEYEPQSPDTEALVSQIAAVLQRQGQHLRLANALLQTQTLVAAVQEALQQERQEQGRQVIERMQWATAAAVAVTPIPALDVLAAVAINARMIGELHALYGQRITFKKAQQAARSLAELLVKLGGVELATQAVGSALKASPLALMGLPLQAASAAYLTRIAGLSYLEWLQSGTPWQLEAMTERMRIQLQNHRQKDFLQQLVGQVRQMLPAGPQPLPEWRGEQERKNPVSLIES
jgi:hypothetical protein